MICENRISLKAARVVRNIISFHYSSRTEESIQVCYSLVSIYSLFLKDPNFGIEYKIVGWFNLLVQIVTYTTTSL